MKRKIEFLPAARMEVRDATRYYERKVRGLGRRFRATVERVCNEIVAQPQLWRVRPGEYRRANVPGFPYYVAFFEVNARIIVVAVGHSSREPEYWKEREIN